MPIITSVSSECSCCNQPLVFTIEHDKREGSPGALRFGYWQTGSFSTSRHTCRRSSYSAVGGSYGSVRNTLVHILSAEWGWLGRCGGAQRGPALVAAGYPSVASLMERWRQVAAHVREFFSHLNDEDLNRIVEFSFGNGPKQAMRLGALMHHAAIHGIHHRGQVALLLRLVGQPPGDFDILFYYGRK